MNRLNGIKLLAVLVGICLVTATVADAAVLEYRLLINGADVDTYSGAAGDITVAVEVRTVDNAFAAAAGNNYLGGVTQFTVNLIDSTGIEAGSILNPSEYIDVVVPGVIENPTGTWDSTTVGDMVSNHTRGKINGTAMAGPYVGTSYDVVADYSYIPNGSLGANSMTFGGGIAAEPDTTGAWTEVLSGQFAYNGGEGTLTMVGYSNEQLLYGPGGSQPNPESVVGDVVTFGAVVANETPTVALPGGDVVEGDWSTELGYNNPAHSVEVSAVGDDADGDPLTYEWTMMKPGGGSKVLGETGATLTLTIAEIESLGLPAWVGAGDPSYNWTLSVTANDGTDTSVPAQIGVFVPEPTTMGLLGFGVLALLKRRRRA